MTNLFRYISQIKILTIEFLSKLIRPKNFLSRTILLFYKLKFQKSAIYLNFNPLLCFTSNVVRKSKSYFIALYNVKFTLLNIKNK